MNSNDEAVAGAVPTTLNELDAVTWRMLGERLEKFQLQLVLIKSQEQMLEAERASTEAKLEAHKTRMRSTYGLSDADRINLETGDIARTAPPLAQGPN